MRLRTHNRLNDTPRAFFSGGVAEAGLLVQLESRVLAGTRSGTVTEPWSPNRVVTGPRAKGMGRGEIGLEGEIERSGRAPGLSFNRAPRRLAPP